MASVRLGTVILPEDPIERGIERFRQAEEMGLAHAWTFDHVSWGPLRGRPWLEAMTFLAAAASATTSISIGTLVSSPNHRHPVSLAHQTMTVDHLSGGRFVLGMGAGSIGLDSNVLGGTALSGRERAARFEEFAVLTDLLLRGQNVTYSGRFFAAIDAWLRPACRQQPRVPFAIAAGGPQGMRLVARLASIWVTIGDGSRPGQQSERDAFATLRSQLRKLEDTCAEFGRDASELRMLVNASRIVSDPFASVDRWKDLVGRLSELGFTDVVVNQPRSHGVFAGDESAYERALAS
jgi:alkanesulfonate monooxygenase SsuD/methylene tetrahydromethanopterin reductase-like flavin-dependent oxidoreductase (luciferase family)